jgi:uncharacterized protein
MGLKEQLTQLIQLQTIDSEIYILKKEKESKPQELKAIDAAFEEKKQSLAKLEKASLDAQKQKKDAELELSTKEESIKKLQTQLFQLKTNKEYQTMLQQIQDVKADCSVVEDKILAAMDLIDKVKNDTALEKQRLQEEEKVFGAQKQKIQDRVKEIDGRLQQLESQRGQLLPLLEKKIYSQYERILQNRDGLAIVKVFSQACSGCNMSVTPQTINLIKMYEHIITCEVCNRILYIDDETS